MLVSVPLQLIDFARLISLTKKEYFFLLVPMTIRCTIASLRIYHYMSLYHYMSEI